MNPSLKAIAVTLAGCCPLMTACSKDLPSRNRAPVHPRPM